MQTFISVDRSKRLNIGESSFPAKETLYFISSAARAFPTCVHTWHTPFLKADFHQKFFQLCERTLFPAAAPLCDFKIS